MIQQREGFRDSEVDVHQGRAVTGEPAELQEAVRRFHAARDFAVDDIKGGRYRRLVEPAIAHGRKRGVQLHLGGRKRIEHLVRYPCGELAELGQFLLMGESCLFLQVPD